MVTISVHTEKFPFDTAEI